MTPDEQKGERVEQPICANCGERPGTVKWLGDGGYLALSHGMWRWWCEVCATKAQLDYARERAAAIPELEAKLGMALPTQPRNPGS